MNNSRRIVGAQILALFLLALVARIAMLIIYPFDGLYGQDAFAYYDYSIALKVALSHSQSIPPFFWPIGFPLQLVLSLLVFGVRPIAAQFVSLIAGAAIAPLTYLIARETVIDVDPVRARRVGMIAASMMIFAGQLMISSLSIMSDATALMWAMLSAWLLVRYIHQLHSANLVLAVITLSIAVLNRWAYGLLGLPWTLAVLSVWRQRHSSISIRRMLGLTLLSLAIVGAIIVAQQVSGSLNTGTFEMHTWNPVNAIKTELTNDDGVFRYALPMGLYYLRPVVDPAFIFPLWLPLLIVGGWSMRRRMLAEQWVLIGWVLVTYIYLGGETYQNPRFSLELFPPLALWVAAGFDRVWLDRPQWRGGLNGLAAVALIGSAIWSARVVGNFVAEKNSDLERAQHISTLLPADAQVITFRLTLTLMHYTSLDVI